MLSAMFGIVDKLEIGQKKCLTIKCPSNFKFNVLYVCIHFNLKSLYLPPLQLNRHKEKLTKRVRKIFFLNFPNISLCEKFYLLSLFGCCCFVFCFCFFSYIAMPQLWFNTLINMTVFLHTSE